MNVPRRNLLTQEYLKSVLIYNKTTGVFVWNKSGKIAGYLVDGYLVIRINQKQYRLHRLAWLYVFGYFPHTVDHRDRKKTHNWIDNLRDASRLENADNTKRADDRKLAYETQRSDLEDGIYYRKDRNQWRVRAWTRVGGKRKRMSVGNYNSYSEAFVARNKFRGLP